MTNAGMLGNTQSLHYNGTFGKTMDLLGWCKVWEKLRLIVPLHLAAVMQAVSLIKNYRNTLEITQHSDP